MPDSPAGERTEEATPKRRLEARRKGTVARSADLVSALVIVALLLVMPSALGNLGRALLRTVQLGIANVPHNVEPSTISRYGWNVLQGPLFAFLPILGVATIVGLAANYAQVGFMFSAEALQPNFEKINPLSGFKKMFGPRAGMEGMKACLKAGLFAFLAWSAIQSHWKDLLALGWGTTSDLFTVIGSILHEIFLKVCLAWLTIAAFDYYFQRKQVDKQLRMTKQEVKQEMRELEQAPELKREIVKRRRIMGRNRMMESVKKADVVVTNPTHYAVALQYEAGKLHAPRVVAKGQDLIALKIREVASEHKVPIVPNPPLARQLYKRCEIGEFVPRELFQAVAEVLAYVYRTMRRKA